MNFVVLGLNSLIFIMTDTEMWIVHSLSLYGWIDFLFAVKACSILSFFFGQKVPFLSLKCLLIDIWVLFREQDHALSPVVNHSILGDLHFFWLCLALVLSGLGQASWVLTASVEKLVGFRREAETAMSDLTSPWTHSFQTQSRDFTCLYCCFSIRR